MVRLKNIVWNGDLCRFTYIVECEWESPGSITVRASTGKVIRAEYSEEDPFHTYAGHAIQCVCELYSRRDFKEEAVAAWY